MGGEPADASADPAGAPQAADNAKAVAAPSGGQPVVARPTPENELKRLREEAAAAERLQREPHRRLNDGQGRIAMLEHQRAAAGAELEARREAMRGQAAFGQSMEQLKGG